MTQNEQKQSAKLFAAEWKNRGDEKQETQSFWIDLLQNVMGVESATKYISFEKPVVVDDLKTGNKTTKFIDAYIHDTNVIIEQKSSDIDLRKGAKQSDGSMLTPFQQARRYGGYLSKDEQPQWIVVCNFKEFHIHDMNRPNDAPEVLLLSDLDREFPRLQFLVEKGNTNIQQEMEISIKAGEVVGLLYDAFLKQYKDPESEDTLKSLNKLCVRLVFCLYAEDAGIFGKHLMFHDYLKQYDAKSARKALRDLFKVLNQKPEERDQYLSDDDPLLAAFPYVNGGLFADDNIEIPPLTDEILNLILTKGSEDFDWSQISPTIFGAVFESTLNPETRRSGGMHYTSIENIHKVVDPLFLDDLKAEYAQIMELNVLKSKRTALEKFQDKLASITCLDPAAGSGNFLTESYISLRRLENKVIEALIATEKGGQEGQIIMGEMYNPIKVSISQFYGIEINDFAVTVAQTALWIAESQMMQETEAIIHMSLDFLPLKTHAHIVEGNALRIDWESVVPKDKLNYIMGNPPFVGARFMNKVQKADINDTFTGWKNVGNLDYVCCWYKKAADMMAGTVIRSALVSTNSVTQGEAVPNLWRPLFNAGVHIDFAHRTFRWDSEASIKAHVHCVIVGFSSAALSKPKVLYTDSRPQIVTNINGYLLDADDVFVSSRNKPICDVPEIGIGNKPIDGGFYLFEKAEMEEFLKKEPAAEPFFHPWYGAREFINRKPRYCLYLGDCQPSVLRSMPECMKRVQAVRDYRLASPSPGTRKIAETPTKFHVTNMPKGTFLVIPQVSSERRKYIPIGYMNDGVLCSDKVRIMPDSTSYHFGVLTSNVHMAWMRTICCRLKSDYSYTVNDVYNNFPWPTPTEAQKTKIEQTAQAILDARALYPDSSLADLYDELTMPPELRTAHQNNDRAVMAAYGFDVKTMTEASCVAELMKMYKNLVDGEGK